ncbi:M20 metallopeptidase family protein [Kurthia sibirica]|uniref:Amidohydrolase n=1 Tax=Kurthia sibirica TaxID=202750 RepID=A0A2U3AHV1_9BACL|nr:amidohydrolase [Kurthia sibirica]PWI24133.1 amidohydrolase [Kurthia sibirica]GEK35484.1 N-acyl-L-amino acid amidohydrolase [Kurthia sibirica]
MTNEIISESLEISQQIIQWRRYIHQNPELSRNEFKTSQFIEEQLRMMPYLELKKLTPTSICGILKGSRQGRGKTILLRADIDALPIQEELDLPFASQNPNVMHACGHDAHAAMLLGAAKILTDLGTDFSGEVRFVFQHAEEVTPGGAEELVAAGITDGVDNAFALHVYPYYKAGEFALRAGKMNAAGDDFEIEVVGSGGHASTPELTVDPIIVGTQIIQTLQTIVSRKVPAIHAPVVTVTQFHCGDALNIIANKADIGGTIRSHNNEVRVKAREELENIVYQTAAMHGATATIKWDIGCAAVQNDHQATAISIRAAQSIVGEKNTCTIAEPMFGAEDFAAYSEEVPSSMQFIGVHNESFGEVYPLHHPKFQIDESALVLGSRYFVEIVKELCEY